MINFDEVAKLIIAATCGVALAFWLWKSPVDETDSTIAGRSGLFLYTDYGTGVQYVGTLLGGITPRLNADGSLVVVPVPKATDKPKVESGNIGIPRRLQ